MTTVQQAAPDAKVLERVRKLLRVAAEGSGASEAEVQFAAARAAEMMEEHGLSTMAVEASGGEGEGRTKDERELSFGAWYGPLMEAVSESCFVACEVRRHGNGKRVSFQLIGRQSAVVTATLMFEYLRAAIWRLSREANVDSARWFRHGCAERVIQRIRARHVETLRRQKADAEREMRERTARAAHPSATPTGTSLVVTLLDYAQQEHDLNEDFRRGVAPGTTARERDEAQARAKARDLRYEELQREGISREVAFDMAYLGWSRERSERYQETLRVEQKMAERKPRAERYRAYHYKETREDKKRRDPSFRAGHAAGEKVGLDQQVGKSATKKIGG